jgi:glutamate carboxypeptidase
MRLNDPRRGITVNANVIEGGTRTNVIAERASARIDLRVTSKADIPKLERLIRSVRPVLKGARLEVRGGIGRPPMEQRMARALFHKARALARRMGFELRESFVGGGSDGNFTAALGVPTLDGLGGVGAGAHSSHENVVIRALSERAALLAGLLLSERRLRGVAK